MAGDTGRRPPLALEVIPLDDLTLDWAHTYLLGWYGPDNRPYLTTWRSTPESLIVQVVVTGPVLPFGPPLWDAPAPHKEAPWLPSPHPWQEFTLHLVGLKESARERARAWGGVRAIGWYIREGFQRGWHVPGCQKGHPLGETPCWGAL